MITESYPLTREEVNALRNYLVGNSSSGMIGGSNDVFNCRTDLGKYSIVLEHAGSKNSVAVVMRKPRKGDLEKIIKMLKVKARETILVGETQNE